METPLKKRNTDDARDTAIGVPGQRAVELTVPKSMRTEHRHMF